MMNKKNNLFLMIILSMLIFTISTSESKFQILGESYNVFQTSFPEIKAYSNHESIRIISDDNFTDYGFSGYGNNTRPYIIENLNIISYVQDAILIQDTTKHFVIRNCHLTGTRGIMVTNVGTNTISILNNTITHCNYTAIWIRESAGVVLHDNILQYKSCRIILRDVPYSSVVNNSCFWGQIDIDCAGYSNITDNTCAGIVCGDSRNIILEDNLCQDTFYGIKIKYSRSNKILNNTCINCNVGLSIESCPNSVISGNNFSNSILTGISSRGLISSNFTNNICEYNLEVGMSFVAGEYLLVKNNTCNHNGLYGIKISDNEFDVNEPSDFVNNFCEFNGIGIKIKDANRRMIANNTFSNNLEYGMHLEYASYNSIHYNILENNSDFGIFSTWSWQNDIFYNDFINNNAEMLSGFSQCFDEGFNNHWYDEENQLGNYWSDYIGEGNYTIDGGEDFVDRYPNAEPFRYEITTTPTQTPVETEEALTPKLVYISFYFLGVTFLVRRRKMHHWKV